MSLESNPDQSNRKVKRAMWDDFQRSSSNTSLSLSTSLSDTTLESSILLDHIRLGPGSLKKHGVFGISMPRVHSACRAVDGEEQTDANRCLSITSGDVPHDNISNSINLTRRLSNATISTKLNIPGNSVIVSEIHPVPCEEPSPLLVFTTEKLKPYPPGSITVVKEGPSHESLSSVLLSSFEKELKDFGSSNHTTISTSLPPDDESYTMEMDKKSVENTSCHCRIELEDRLHDAFKKCLQLQHKVELADAKCIRWELEAGEAAENVATLKTKVSELEIELAARNASLHGLKAKVAQQFMENDDISERRRQYERDCKAQLSQMDALKKSEQWYREQLHLTQVERSSLQMQLMAEKENVTKQLHELDRLRVELKRTQDQLAEIEEKALKEKQSFTFKLEKALTFSSDFSFQEDPGTPCQMVDEHAVSELKQRISDLEISLESNNSMVHRSGEEIDRLLSRNLQLQRELSETKIKLQEEQDRHTSAVKDRDKAEADLKEKEQALLLLSREHATLAVRFEGGLREKAEMDEALQSLTRNFTNVSSRFNTMRAETQTLGAKVEAYAKELRCVQGERDALRARLEEAGRREQSSAVAARLQADEREVSARTKLEHEVMALREAADRTRPALERFDQLQLERDQLAASNDALRAKVDSLSQLLQQNTGSRVRPDEPLQDQAQSQLQQLQVELSKLQAEKSQLQVDNDQLHGQAQRSGARLDELSRTIQELETEMAPLREEQTAASLEATRLRSENSLLQRAKHDLEARVDELSVWLDAVTQATSVGQAERRLSRLSTTPVRVEAAGGSEAGDGPLEALQDANTALALHAAALQRRLDRLEADEEASPRPDLLSGSQGSAQPAGDDGHGLDADERGLAALLEVCVRRVRKAGLGDDVVRHHVAELTAILDTQPDAEARLRVLEEEHHDLKDREGRRDELVRVLLARLKDQVLARKAAEHKMAVLGQAACRTCTPAAGDGLPSSARLEQELSSLQAAIADLHLQLFNERRDASQLRKEVSSLRLGLDTANDMLDSNKVALGRSEAYSQVLKVSKDQLQERFEREQCEHEDCRQRLERLQEQLHEARAKDPMVEVQLKTLGVHLHQRSGEVRSLQERLLMRDQECVGLREQLEKQRDAARHEYSALQRELRHTQQEFADALRKMSNGVPDPVPCDEEGLTALIQESNRLSPAVLDDLKALLHNLKAELKSVEKEVGFPLERTGPAVQHV